MNLPKSRSYVLRDESDVNVNHYALLDDVRKLPARRSRPAITVILVLIGLLAGWIGGKFLTGSLQRSTIATDVPTDESAARSSQLQPDNRPSANVIVPGAKSARPKDVPPESPQDVDSQPSVDVRVDEQQKERADRAVEIPGEQEIKEIGQGAMVKLLKEGDKIKRGKHLKANKNEE